MHELYMLGANLGVILIGLLYNGKQISDLRKELRSEVSGLRGEMAGLRGEIASVRGELRSDIQRLEDRMDGRFDSLHRDLIQLSREQGKHDARLDALESKKT